MTTIHGPINRPRLVALSGAAAFLLAACGGGDDRIDPPRLGAAAPAALTGSCSDLQSRLPVLPDTRIAAVSAVAAGALKQAGQDVPAHCLVSGAMHERVSAIDAQAYAINFEMRLPLNWNGRFFHQGNGGLDGNVATATGTLGGGPRTGALLQGFAVLSSDAGHRAAQNPGFGIDPQARLDYGYQAAGKLTPVAKSVIRSAYGKGPDRSYFGGCSNGGRHTLVAAARQAGDYDGYVALAPGFNLPKAAVANIAAAQRLAGVASNPADLSTAFSVAERATVSNAVLARCDAIDGLADGIVADTSACQKTFNLQTDVPTCTGARDGSCLTAAQKTAIGSIFAGVTTSSGAPVYASFPYDNGLATTGFAFWKFTAPLVLDSGAVGQVFKVPPEPSAGFNGPAFTLSASIDTLVAQINATNSLYAESAMSFMTPPNPADLSSVRDRGGKLIVVHGVNDPIFSADDTARWYQSLAERNGGDATDFARLFRVPGMGHCSGGPSTDQFDLISPIVAWVEQGQAPDRIAAQARGPGNPGGANADLPAAWSATRGRPLCPFPKVARYNGSGPVDDAASFNCQ